MKMKYDFFLMTEGTRRKDKFLNKKKKKLFFEDSLFCFEFPFKIGSICLTQKTFEKPLSKFISLYTNYHSCLVVVTFQIE